MATMVLDDKNMLSIVGFGDELIGGHAILWLLKDIWIIRELSKTFHKNVRGLFFTFQRVLCAMHVLSPIADDGTDFE